MHAYNGVLTILGFACFLYFVFCVSVKIKFTVPLLLFVCIPPGKAVVEMTYTVSGGTLNPTYSLTSAISHCTSPVTVHRIIIFSLEKP